MRVLVAFDKFKEALTAIEACEAAAAVVRQRQPDAEVDLCPLTDGGDGFTEVLTRAVGGDTLELGVIGPRGEPVTAKYGIIAWSSLPPAAQARLALDQTPSRVVVLEMAAASGLTLVPPEDRDPWLATSVGTGELIRAAEENGAECVLLGIGGSATIDLGFGALAALGWRFLGTDGTPVMPPVPARFDAIGRIVAPRSHRLPPIRIACDVTNPLLGENGAITVYGPQKGLLPEDRNRFEATVARMATSFCEQMSVPLSVQEVPGAGAAGGAGFGLMVAAGAKLLSGSDLIADWLELDRRVAAADLVLTGEGHFDSSSLSGKGPGAVLARAALAGKPVRVLAGDFDSLTTLGPQVQLHRITPPDIHGAAALSRCREFLAAKVAEIFA